MSLLPETKDKYIGIEIECISKYAPPIVAYLIKKYGLEKEMEIGFDASVTNPYLDDHFDEDEEPLERFITNDRDDGYEFRLLTKQSNLLTTLNKVGLLLKDIKAKATDQCGLHVHLDIRDEDKWKVFDRLYKQQQTLLKATPKERLDCDYCNPIDADEVVEIKSEYYNTKYKAINPLTDYDTIEIRTHEGTVDVKEIYNWCSYLIDVAYKKTIEPKNIKYIEQRIKKFA